MLHKIKLLIPIVGLLAVSCKKFLDINTDPNNPTTIEVSKLLPTTQRTLGDALSMDEQNGGLSEVLAVYTHQMSTRENPDKYGITGADVNLQTAWSKLFSSTANPGTTFPVYGVLQNLEDIITKSTEAGNLVYAGIAKILKAYTYSVAVDVFGDVPYSEANKLKQGILHPKFDDDASIYESLFPLINEGIADLTNTSAPNNQEPGADDLMYGGDVDLWIKAANTIKLKLYTQIRKVKNVSAEVNALLSGGKLISNTSESFLVPYGPNGATDDRNPGFYDYFATQRSNHVSPWFYEILKGYNPNIFKNNPDPRLKYYIYNQVNATQPSRDGNQTEYRDGPFVSIYFGSVGPDRDRTQQNTISLFGIYPVGGKYDDGSATIASASSGTGAAPYRLLTYADRLYLEAELINTGVITGDAKAKLAAAMDESFKQVDYVITNFVNPSQNVPALFGTAAVATYTDKVLVEYDAASTAKKLEIIMTQKWLSSVGSAVDQYTDIRRTGYPVVFDPSNPAMAPGGRVQPPINGDPVNPGNQKSVPVQQSRTFALALPWFQTELESNPNAPAQKNPSTYKIFWMP
ncbi:MAG: SusD/RagB family nutrient-binding outer membrane lipoprotein [Bacteroidetes bacterium]|nr:MAG: SusD/RagB family nutrient-binding outer membrane lipoprotein [Bacteroidota bacterium]